jgi:hypothetical protein
VPDGDFSPLDFGELTDLEVLRRWFEVMGELQRRGMVWSGKSPIADYVEYLVAKHYGVEPIRGTNPGHDLVTRDGRRASRSRHAATPREARRRTLASFQSSLKAALKTCVVVLFEDDLRVRVAYRTSYEWAVGKVRPRGEYHRLYISDVLASADKLERLELDQS